MQPACVISTITCPTEAGTMALGAQLSASVLGALLQADPAPASGPQCASAATPFVLHLSGPLGVGKSSLCRAFLRALGVQGAIKSPSYALMEVYNLLNCSVYHFDFYRLSSPLELLEYGLLEPMETRHPQPCIILVEWPEQAQGVLPCPDILVQLDMPGAVQASEMCAGQNNVPASQTSRSFRLQGFSPRGQLVVNKTTMQVGQ